MKQLFSTAGVICFILFSINFAAAHQMAEGMVDNLMDFFPMLDGDVTVSIEYNNTARTAVMTITQIGL